MEISEDDLMQSVPPIMRDDVRQLRDFFRKLELSNSTSLLSAIRLVKLFDIATPKKLAKNITKHDLSLKATCNLLKADESDAEIVLEDLTESFPNWFNEGYRGSCDRLPPFSARNQNYFDGISDAERGSCRSMSERAVENTARDDRKMNPAQSGSVRKIPIYAVNVGGKCKPSGLQSGNTRYDDDDGGGYVETNDEYYPSTRGTSSDAIRGTARASSSSSGSSSSSSSSSSSAHCVVDNKHQKPKGAILQVIPNSGACCIKGFTCTAYREGMPSVGCPGYPVYSGKWYFEVMLVTGWYGPIQIGWADSEFHVEKCRGKRSDTFKGVGDDDHSWAADGFDQSCTPGKLGKMSLLSDSNSRLWKNGVAWEFGDVIGCSLDIANRIIEYHVYKSESGVIYSDLQAFEGFSFQGGLYPCVSIEKNETVTLNFGFSRIAAKIPLGYMPYSAHLQSVNKAAVQAAVQESLTANEDVPKTMRTPIKIQRSDTTSSQSLSPSSTTPSRSSGSGSVHAAAAASSSADLQRKYTLKPEEVYERWLTLRREKLEDMEHVPFPSVPPNLTKKTIIFRWKDHDLKLDVWEKGVVYSKNTNPKELQLGFKWNVSFLDTISGKREIRACQLDEKLYLHSEEELMHSAEWVDKIGTGTWAVYDRMKSSTSGGLANSNKRKR